MKLIKYIPENDRVRTPSQLILTIIFLLGGAVIIGIGTYPITQEISILTILSLVFVNGFGLLILYSGVLGILNWISNGPSRDI